jgi:hypothetical protein
MIEYIYINQEKKNLVSRYKVFPSMEKIGSAAREFGDVTIGGKEDEGHHPCHLLTFICTFIYWIGSTILWTEMCSVLYDINISISSMH